MNQSQMSSKIHDKIQIAGFKSNIKDFNGVMEKISRISRINSDCVVQIMDADGIAGRKHVMHAAIHAVNAFQRNENIAKDLGLEICVRASAQRQISRALDVLGIKEGEMNICAVAVGCDKRVMVKLGEFLGERDDSVLEPDESVLKKIYNISDRELETIGSIGRILMEKTSLLILEK
ncbi:MAG: KEOPS complex subunit Cgi121 [Methanobacterium paludis]|nr:KEOPS complex subunit Cgi121 [Methanobacterium paludis]